MARIDHANMHITSGARDWLFIGIDVDESDVKGVLRETISITKLLRSRISVEVTSVLPNSYLFTAIPEGDQRSGNMNSWKHVEEISGVTFRPRRSSAYVGRRVGARLEGGGAIDVTAATSIGPTRPHAPVEAGNGSASLTK